MAEQIFPGNFFFVVNYGFSFFGEIPIDHFLISCFSWDWLIIFCWFLAQRCKMAMPKKWRSPIFKKNFFWANLGQKLPENRVFWTLCKIASLVFSDFWQKDRGQCVLKNGRNIFSRKIFFRRKIRIFVFWGNSLWPFSNFLLFSGLAHYFLLIFGTKMQNGNAQNVTEPDFRKKFFLGKFGPNTTQN